MLVLVAGVDVSGWWVPVLVLFCSASRILELDLTLD